MQVNIRKATGADAAAILAYCKQIGDESDNLTFGGEGVPLTVEQEQAYLDSLYTAEKSLYLVADLNGEIVGTCSYSSFPRERLAHRAEFSISVKKDLWGHHIGTMLMERMLDFARNVAKTEILSLEVRSDNRRAIALYRKFGFETVGTFKGFMKIHGDYVDCDIMRLELPR